MSDPEKPTEVPFGDKPATSAPAVGQIDQGMFQQLTMLAQFNPALFEAMLNENPSLRAEYGRMERESVQMLYNKHRDTLDPQRATMYRQSLYPLTSTPSDRAADRRDGSMPDTSLGEAERVLQDVRTNPEMQRVLRQHSPETIDAVARVLAGRSNPTQGEATQVPIQPPEHPHRAFGAPDPGPGDKLGNAPAAPTRRANPDMQAVENFISQQEEFRMQIRDNPKLRQVVQENFPDMLNRLGMDEE